MMGESKVTDYMILYLKENQISRERIAAELAIPENKLRDGYEEPLLADEFLRLCARLHIKPEEVAAAIRNSAEQLT